MKTKQILYLGIIYFFMFAAVNSNAETIITKSGKEVQGKILERTDKYIKVEVSGVPVTYFLDEIETIRTEIPKPPFKTLKVTYKTMHKMLDDKGQPVVEEEGKKVIYLDFVNNKNREESVSTTNMGGFQTTKNELKIFDGKREYNIKLDENKATYMDIPQPDGYVTSSMENVMDNKFLVGQEEILGRKCNAYKTERLKMWFWNGILLKEENKSPNSYQLTESVAIEEDTPIDADKFEIPKGVSVKSWDAEMAEIQKGLVDTMKDLGSVYGSTADKAKAQEGPLSPMDIGRAIFDPAAEQKMVDQIKNDPSIPDSQKQEMINNLKQMIQEQRKTVEGARTEGGKIDLDKAEKILLQERDQANYISALARCRTILTACEAYKSVNNTYPENLRKLGEEKPSYLDGYFLSKMDSEEGIQSYQFLYKFIDKGHFQLFAKPIKPNLKTIFVDEIGIFHVDNKEGLVIDTEKEMRY